MPTSKDNGRHEIYHNDQCLGVLDENTLEIYSDTEMNSSIRWGLIKLIVKIIFNRSKI